MILTGFALRLVLLDRFSFHQDEAIYSFWALHGRHVDPLFLTVWPDKPPLYLWLLGFTLDLFGATPAAARLLNIACSTLTIVVVAALARTWWGARAGVLAALLMALNPFAISFAPTAFTDPLLVLAGMLALYAAVRRQLFWAGVWLGVAFMTKQQGLLFAPLVLLFGLSATRALARPVTWRTLQDAVACVAGVAVIVAPVMFWDSLRWAVAPSPWDLGGRNAVGFSLAAPALWLPRLEQWGQLGAYLVGGGLGGAGGLALAVMFALVLPPGIAARVMPLRMCTPALLLTLWGAAYLALHVVTEVQVWDRYLLPLAPVAVLLLAFAAETALAIGAAGQSRWRFGLLVSLAALLLLMLPGPALQAAHGLLPIGGDHGAYSGFERVAAWLDAQTDADAAPVIYHRNLGWHLRFALFAPVQNGRAELRWFPSSAYLADNAAKTPHRPRFLVVADWSPARDLILHLMQRRLTADVRLRTGQFTLYEIGNMPSAPVTWRVCRPPAADFTGGAPSAALHALAQRWRNGAPGDVRATGASPLCTAEVTP